MDVRRTLLTIAILGLSTGTLAQADPPSNPDPATPFATPDTLESLYLRAGDLYEEQRYQEAIPLFDRVVEIDPRHGNAYALLGGSYLHLGDYPRAIHAFERALELDEGIKLAYLGLVSAHYLSERIDDARQWVLRMIPILSGEERDRYLATIADQFPRLDLLAAGGS